jgi:uncharacterized membrane protein YccC
MQGSPMLSISGRIAGWMKAYGARWRFCLRMTVAAVSAFALAQILTMPLHGLWAVLTAVAVTQMSVGGSLRATGEYVLGTVGGAIYASAVGVFVPHATVLALAGALAIAVAPLALAAALRPSFRVAPFTALIVLLISSQFGEGPIESGFYRVLEVTLGGLVAVVVSLVVFPGRANRLALAAAARLIEQLSHALPALLTGFTRQLDDGEIVRIQDGLGQAVSSVQAMLAEAGGERFITFAVEPDPGPLLRTLLRLRHDLVIIGRAAIAPLPDPFAARLGPLLQRIGETGSNYLHAAAMALAARNPPPPLEPVLAEPDGYAAEITALRNGGFTRKLSSNELEQVFALGFALDQLHQHLNDLGRCVQEWATAPQAPSVT